MRRVLFMLVPMAALGLAACSNEVVPEAPPVVAQSATAAVESAETGVPIASFLADVGAPFGLAMVPEGKVASARIAHEASGAPPGVVLGEVLRRNGWIVVVDGSGRAVVCEPEWYEARADEGQFRRWERVPAARPAAAIAELLANHAFIDAVVRVKPGPDGDAIEIAGVARTVDELEAIVMLLDKPPGVESPEARRFADETLLVRILNARQSLRDGTPLSEPPAVSAEDGPSSVGLSREERLRLHEKHVRKVIEDRRRRALLEPCPVPAS